MVQTAILCVLQSKIEKGDPKHKKGTQIPKKVPMGIRVTLHPLRYASGFLLSHLVKSCSERFLTEDAAVEVAH